MGAIAAHQDVRIVLDEESWDKFHKALSPARFRAVIRMGMRVGIRRGAIYLAKQMKSAIKRRSYVANRVLTIALKGHGLPLVGVGLDRPPVGQQPNYGGLGLRDQITYHMINHAEVHIGTSRRSGGGHNLAEILHDGITIRITPKMGIMLATLAEHARQATGISPGRMAEDVVRAERKRYHRQFGIGSSTSGGGYLRIPARPYLTSVFGAERHQKKVADLINGAIIDKFQREMRKLGARTSGTAAPAR